MRFGRAFHVAYALVAVGGIAVAVARSSSWLWLDILAGVAAGLCLLSAGVFLFGFLAWRLFVWVVDDGRP